MSGEQKDGSHMVEAIQVTRGADAERYAEFLGESHLQADQLVSTHANFPSLNIGGALVRILFAMPNRWSLYTFKIPKQAYERSGEAARFHLQAWPGPPGQQRAWTECPGDRLGAAFHPGLHRDRNGRSQRMTTFRRSTASRSPRPPRKPGSPSAARHSCSNSTLLDLLAAKAVGEKLSPRALSYMIERRWLAENKGDALGFFTLGKRQPTPEEAAALAPNFIAWAREHAPPFR